MERAGLKRLLAPLIDDTRPMDAMPLSFDTPCEDEIAPSCLTGAVTAGGSASRPSCHAAAAPEDRFPSSWPPRTPRVCRLCVGLHAPGLHA